MRVSTVPLHKAVQYRSLSVAERKAQDAAVAMISGVK